MKASRHLANLLIGVVLVAGCDESKAPFAPSGTIAMEDLLAAPLVVEANPSGIAPLTAVIRFRTHQPATVELAILGTSDRQPLDFETQEPARRHALPVLGLLPDTWNAVELSVSTAAARTVDTVLVATDTLPSFLPNVEVTTATPELMEPGWTLSDLLLSVEGGRATYPMAFDETGTIRWYLDLSSLGLATPVERLRTGNLVAGFGGRIREYDMLGRVVTEWTIGPEYQQHHDVFEKRDGNLVVPVSKPSLETVEDHIVELDRSSGAVVAEWDLREALDVDRTALVDDTRDWVHVNSVWVDPSDEGLIISGRHQGVFKVSEDNELQWILAPHLGWGRAGVDGQGHETAPFLLTAVDEAGTPHPPAVQSGYERLPGFDWPWAQHAAMRLANGNILLFDNGAYRGYEERGTSPYSRAVEYEIDEEAMTVRQVWAYGRERGTSFYASFVSDVDYLGSTGNRLVMPGIAGSVADGYRAYVTEVAPDGAEVFEAEIHFANALGARSDIVYRSERLQIYPE